MKATILDQEIKRGESEGYTLLSYSDGIASYARQSNSGNIIWGHKQTFSEKYEYVILTGAKKRYKSQGTKNAIMIREIL